MARLIQTPTGGGVVGPFERLVLQALLDKLPNEYSVAPNFQLKQRGHDALEYDFTVIAPHAVYVLEAKEWYGRLSGDDSEWLLNQTPKKCPLWLVNTKSKVLKTELGPVGGQVYVAPALVIPDGTQNLLEGNWASHVTSLTELITYLQDPSRIPKSSDIRAYQKNIETVLQGKWGTRQRERRRRIGGYEIAETLYADDRSGEYIATRALIEGDPTRYRIRTWRLDPSLLPEAREKQMAVIRRPTEAVSKIGQHPNLLRVLQFDFVDEDNEFFEVTEWSEVGTLHGFLANRDRGPLTLRERLEIAAGVAAALEAVHVHGVVHRNVCPETILIGFDRKPRLTDFDRAYIDSKYTVFSATATRRINRAYVPPELEDATDYDFDASSDMYSFGVLFYQLLTDRVPFEDAKEARAKQGQPDSLPSSERQDISQKVDALTVQLLRVDDFKARPPAARALSVLDEVLGLTTGSAQTPSAPPPPAPPSLEVGSILRGVMEIKRKLGQGGFGKVFLIYHFDYQRLFALKLLDNDGYTDMMLHEVREIWPRLPEHPNIVRPFLIERLDPPERTPYILSEFVDGETLEAYCDGRKTLPWSDIQRIGIELLDALACIHPNATEYEALKETAAARALSEDTYNRLQGAKEKAQSGVVHRDIKPANIMLDIHSDKARLIDFNVAAVAVEASGSAGSPPYWAPDRMDCPPTSLDLFSLGVVLYELVMQRHPYPDRVPGRATPYDPRAIAVDMRISNELAELLLKAVQPNASDRFQSALEMSKALMSIQSMFAPASPPPVDQGRVPGITVSAEEAGTPNYNPYVTRLLTLYSQARRSNAGTRGLDEIALLTYVQTRLDEKLAPAIVSGRFRLVIVTGNAGDGKTAFLQQVESLARRNGANVETLPSGNGSRWTFQGLNFETNYDGSQDEGDRENDAVLARFFEPFAGGVHAAAASNEGRLLAINEGRLLDFLNHSEFASRFVDLKRFVAAALDGTEQQPQALLVNLNLRAVTAGGAESLVEKQLVAMLKESLWAPCEGCALRARCPIKHNVDSLRDAASGRAVRERIRRLFEIVHLRRRAHVTMRDLRSALSFMLLHDQSCGDVGRLLSRTDARVTEDLARLYYPNAFADVQAEDGQVAGSTERAGDKKEERAVDRLVRRLRETDVGLVNSPLLDRRLDYDADTAVPWMTFENRSQDARTVMQALARDTPAAPDGASLPALLDKRRRLLALLRRWAYFERRDEGWRLMLPYRSIGLLERVVAKQNDADFEHASETLRDKVVEAISLSEGVHSERVRRNYLALRITRTKDAPIRSYRLFPKKSFRVVPRIPELADYMEYAPDAVELVAEGGAGVARLRISLDLLEMLELIRMGYRPTKTDLEGLFVNLLIFRNELLTTTFDRVLVTADDCEFFEVSARGESDGIRLLLEKHAAPVGDEQKQAVP